MYRTDVSGLVRAPIDKVWTVFRPFGKGLHPCHVSVGPIERCTETTEDGHLNRAVFARVLDAGPLSEGGADPWKFRELPEDDSMSMEIMSWWKIYDSVELEHPGKDEVGAVRSFVISSDKSRIREELVLRNDAQHVQVYKLLSMEPQTASIHNVSTSIRMNASGVGHTRVEFNNTFDCPSAGVAQDVTRRQSGAYRAAISGLDRFFRPAVGVLRIRLLRGDLQSPCTQHYQHRGLPGVFVVLQMNDGIEQVSTTSPHSNPIWNQSFSLDLTKESTHVQLALWSEEKGYNRQLSAVKVLLTDVSTDTKHMQLNLPGHGCLDVEMQTGAVAQATPSVLDTIRDDLLMLVRSFIEDPDHPYTWTIMPRMQSEPNLALEALPGYAEMPISTEMLSPNKIARVIERATEFVHSQAGLTQRYRESEDKWTAFFSGFLKPPCSMIERWRDDEEFARSFIQGANPMLIKVCNSLDQVPPDMRCLLGQDRTLEELMSEKRLFVVDYKALADIPLHLEKKFYAPVVLLYREMCPDGTGRLMPLGIQLTRKPPGKNLVYTRRSPPYRYLFAKIHVGCAENQMHQFVSHLALTHLLMEPFAIAVHNYLGPKHALGRLLRPHCTDTIGINYVARHTLIAAVGPLTNSTFAVGTVGGLRLAVESFQRYHFMEMSFPRELQNRGFDAAGSDGLEDFLYRDDGFKLWRVLGTYVREVVCRHYHTDADVLHDKGLQDFAAALADRRRGNVTGFPSPITTRELLMECLTNIIFTASAQHSAVNFPQWDFYAYVPPRPEQLTKFMPEGDEDITWDFIASALPDIGVSMFQILFSHILSMPSLVPLTKLNAIGDEFPGIQNDFQAHLRKLSSEIKERNARLEAVGKVPYPYLDPENVASSTDI
ncbi:polyunsaturated fatty acid 5-lipoxygenase-like [Lampetra fluviatilis]